MPLLTITRIVRLQEWKHKLNFKFVINNDFNSQVQSHFLWRNWNIGGDVFVSLFYAPSSVSANNKHKNGFTTKSESEDSLYGSGVNSSVMGTV